MVTEIDIESFVNSELYEKSLLALNTVMPVKITDVAPSALQFSYDVNKITASGASILELNEILLTDLSSFIKYVVHKLDYFLDKTDEQEGNDDEDVTVKTRTFYKNFLIIHLLEYYLLKNNQEKLDDYLKKIRIPKNKKYSSRLKKIYSSL